MKEELRQALGSSCTFNFVNNSGAAKKLALLPGIYPTMKSGVGTGKTINYSDPANLVNAGYTVDQVADDYDSGDATNYVQVSGSNRVKYRDLRQTVMYVGMHVKKIIIQNKATGATANDIFDQEIELSTTAIGTNGEKKYISLQQFVSTAAYDRSKITIDMSESPLYLGPQTFMAMNIPNGANFSMQFCYED